MRRALLVLVASTALASDPLPGGPTGAAPLVRVQGTVPVSGTFWQTTQPVSISSGVPVTGTFWQATQPVSGTLTCNIGSGSFWQATQPVSVAQLPGALDGSGSLKTHEQGSVAVTGTFWPATQPVSGTFWQATQPVSGPLTDTQLRAGAVTVQGAGAGSTVPVSGSVTCNAGSGTFATSGTAVVSSLSNVGQLPTALDGSGSLKTHEQGTANVSIQNTTVAISGTAGNVSATVTQGPAGASLWRVDGSGVTQPISGTLTCNAGTGTLAVSDTAAVADGSAVPTNGVTLSGKDTAGAGRRVRTDTDGNLSTASPRPWSCTLTALGSTLTQCIALVASERLYVTDIIVGTTTATAGTWQLKYGTGTNCGTGGTALTGWAATAPISTAQPQVISLKNPLIPAVANAICVIGTATNTINITVNGYTAP